MLRIKKLIALALLLCSLCLPSFAAVQQNFDYTAFSQLPISHQGRVKPLGRVAQLTLKQIANIDLSAPQASAWMASLLFDPQSADQPAIFHIRNAHLIYALGLETPRNQENAYYNFATLNRAFVNHADMITGLRDMQPDSLQQDQQDLLALYAQVTFYEQLKNALTLLLPLNKPAQQRYIDIAQNPQSSRGFDLIRAQGEMNFLFRVIPVAPILATQETTWLSPWEFWLQNSTDTNLLDLWSNLAKAYISGDAALWHNTSQDLLQQTLAVTDSKFLPLQLKAELLYHEIKPYLLALYLYIAAFLLSLAAIKFSAPLLRYTTWTVFIGGIGFHLTGIVTRIFILQRPPVSNLYESILFVSALLAVTGLWYIYRKREYVLLPALAVTAIALQLLGFAVNDEGDSLQVLQAVLDTKFWLAVHVMTITAGYALCLVTGLLAHAALFVSVKQPSLVLHTHRFYKRAFYFSLLSLLFVSTGTLLGGVWADQSWGRFWGWDPKENGALLIVLWLIWLLHGRISRHISDRAMMVGLSFLNVVVALSWIGVNLLGIGLHSYGFMNGSILSLTVLIAAETLFFAICAFLYLRSKSSHA